jgi:hypothetical protein
MDDIVHKAMAKWPNVPHCYGWLALDGRGTWRMRDDHAQQHHLPGDKITHPALLDFIRRNYQADAEGRWFFQNGPQRVYVDLALAPMIARTDPALGFVNQFGAPIGTIQQAWINPEGILFLVTDEMVAAVSDQDMASCLSYCYLADHVVEDAFFLAWLEDTHMQAPILFKPPHQAPLVLQRLGAIPAAVQFGFVSKPSDAA